PVDAHRALEVHLPGQATAQLDGLQPAPERFGEGALDQAFEATLELLQSHAGASIAMAIRPPSGDTGSGTLGFPTGEWRNWQTRRIQVPVSERTWGFKSPLAHRRRALHRCFVFGFTEVVQTLARWGVCVGGSARGG